MAKGENQLTKKYFSDFAGGLNNFLGATQIKDSESPDATNCDFAGKSGVKNRSGYTQVGEVADSMTKIYGLSQIHTSGNLHQLMKFCSDSSSIKMYYCNDGVTWTAVADTFTDAKDMDSCQAGDKVYTGNGTDVMHDWSGAVWAHTTNGTIGFYPTYYDKRIWVRDDASADTLNFSGQWASAASKLGDFVDATAGTLVFKPGSGSKITGMIKFQNYLYVFLEDSIYRISPASAANTFTVELITNSVGCVSHRSICQVGEDVFFAADDGVYSLGEVANYTSVRTTNKSARVQTTFDAISGTNKKKLVGKYYKFKYHLFYSLFGTNNDSCLVYDIRYNGWQDWRNMAANDAIVYKDSSDDTHIYFGEPTTGEINELYSGSTDDGTGITSSWKSKMFDMKMQDVIKLFMDTTFFVETLTGSMTFSVIFEDGTTSVTKTLSQGRPTGGLGRDALGRKAFGAATNSATTTIKAQNPFRVRAKGQRFAIQYKVTSVGTWELSGISQTYIPFSHYKFKSSLKLN
jgi:hypothetical protein